MSYHGDTCTINGIPYLQSPYLRFGDYDNSSMVERANVRAVLEDFPNAAYVDVSDCTRYHRGSDPVIAVEKDDDGKVTWKVDGGYFWDAAPPDADMFLPRPRRAPRRVRRVRPAWSGRAPSVVRYGIAAHAPDVLVEGGYMGGRLLWLRDDRPRTRSILDGLEDYPLLDESLHSEMEMEAGDEYLKDDGFKEIAKAMNARLPEALEGDEVFDEDFASEHTNDAMNETNAYFYHEADYAGLTDEDVGRIAEWILDTDEARAVIAEFRARPDEDRPSDGAPDLRDTDDCTTDPGPWPIGLDVHTVAWNGEDVRTFPTIARWFYGDSGEFAARLEDGRVRVTHLPSGLLACDGPDVASAGAALHRYMERYSVVSCRWGHATVVPRPGADV